MEQRIEIERLEEAANLFGSFDENIRLIESEFHVVVTNREGELRIAGEPEDTMLADKAVHALLTLAGKGENIGEQTVRYVIGLARSGQADKAAELTAEEMNHITAVCQRPESVRNGRQALADYIRVIQAEAAKRSGAETDPLLAAAEKHKDKKGEKRNVK